MTSNETDRLQQTINGLKVTEKQLTNHCNLYILTTNHITTKLTNQDHDQRHKYHHLTNTLHLTLKMTIPLRWSTRQSPTTVFSKDYPHPDDHTRQKFNTPGFKPFITIVICISRESTRTHEAE